MIVTVLQRSGEWGYNYNVSTKTIQIFDNCPKCGKPRGKPYGYNFCEDGEWFWVNRWENPCGHIDLYKDCLIEAEELKHEKLD